MTVVEALALAILEAATLECKMREGDTPELWRGRFFWVACLRAAFARVRLGRGISRQIRMGRVRTPVRKLCEFCAMQFSRPEHLSDFTPFPLLDFIDG